MILTVVEHEKIHIGKHRDLNKKQISKSDLELIRIIDINNKGIFKWGNRYIIPKQWVGVISIPGLSIEILPKVAGSYSNADIKEILLHMFKVSHNIPRKSNVSSKVNFSKNGIVEILISNYLEKIEYYIREGFISSYNKVSNNLSSIKGSLLFSKHINKNILNPTRFYCKYSKLEINNDINKLIKFTLLKMNKVSKDFNNIKRINTILMYFEKVDSISYRQLNHINIKINIINSRIKEIIDYSNLFLEGYSVSLSSGNNLITSMLFDMNKIFELFIFKSYKKIYGSRISYQDNRNYLITDKGSNMKKIKLKPDILIKTKENANIIIDTKWKEVKTFVKESDVYQMNAYVSGIPNANVAILMYPRTSKSDKAVGNYKFNTKTDNKELRIRTVNLEDVVNEEEFKKQLVDLLKQ